VKLSERELATVARLVRVMRATDYWLGYYVECLLQKDSESAGDLSLKDVEALHTEFKNLHTWEGSGTSS
jgi:hypothetical protein